MHDQQSSIIPPNGNIKILLTSPVVCRDSSIEDYTIDMDNWAVRQIMEMGWKPFEGLGPLHNGRPRGIAEPVHIAMGRVTLAGLGAADKGRSRDGEDDDNDEAHGTIRPIPFRAIPIKFESTSFPPNSSSPPHSIHQTRLSVRTRGRVDVGAWANAAERIKEDDSQRRERAISKNLEAGLEGPIYQFHEKWHQVDVVGEVRNVTCAKREAVSEVEDISSA